MSSKSDPDGTAEQRSKIDEKDEAVLRFIRDSDGDFAGTAEVAERFEMSTQGASYRLKKLRDVGEIESRNISRDEVWYVVGNEGTGKPGPDPSESERAVLATLRESNWPMSVGDVAQETDFSRQTVYTRLQELDSSGKVESGKVAGSTAYRTKEERHATPVEVTSVAHPAYVNRRARGIAEANRDTGGGGIF